MSLNYPRFTIFKYCVSTGYQKRTIDFISFGEQLVQTRQNISGWVSGDAFLGLDWKASSICLEKANSGRRTHAKAKPPFRPIRPLQFGILVSCLRFGVLGFCCTSSQADSQIVLIGGFSGKIKGGGAWAGRFQNFFFKNLLRVVCKNFLVYVSG